MVKISKIIEKIEQFAPLSLQSEWDNSGWQIYLGNIVVNKVLLALSPTLNVIEQAVNQGCDLVISHHPMIFSPINKLSVLNYNNLALIKAVQNNIQVYAAHTNLDTAQNGVADKLADLLELKNLSIIKETNENSGFGRVGELLTEENLDDFLVKLKKILNTTSIKLINPANKNKVKKIAVCPGSGGDFIKDLKGVDLYITGDIRYHSALEVSDMIVVDAGHMETERIILSELKNLLQEFEIEVQIAEENSPWEIV